MPALAAIAEVCKGVGCVLAREAALPQAFVHVSAFAGIAGMLSPNILTLRLLSVLSSTSALSFNLWKRMLSPVFWNLTFIAVNLSRIAQLLLASKDSVTLDANEQRLYELGFMRYGVSLRDYATLLREAGGEWREYAADEEIVREGDPMPLLWYVVEGEVEVVRDEGARVVTVLRPGKGGWCGELWDPNQDRDYWQRPHHWLAGFRASAHSLLVAFDRRKLHDVIARSEELQDAASAAEVADLWGKLRAARRQAVLSEYHAMRAMAKADATLGHAEQQALEHFAAKHALTAAEVAREEHHEELDLARAAEALAHLADPATECAQESECDALFGPLRRRSARAEHEQRVSVLS